MKYLDLAEQALLKRSHREEVYSSPGIDDDVAPVSDTRIEETIRRAAVGLLNLSGARIFERGGRLAIGIPERTNTPEILTAVEILFPSGTTVEQLATPASDPDGIAWSEWKADMLNRLFEQLGADKRRGQIEAGTVRHGDRP